MVGVQRVRKRVLAHPLLVVHPSSMETTSPLDLPLVGLREANIYISIYEGYVKVCALIASLVIALAYATASSSVMLTGQWSLPIWLAWMRVLVMRGAIAADASQ